MFKSLQNIIITILVVATLSVGGWCGYLVYKSDKLKQEVASLSIDVEAYEKAILQLSTTVVELNDRNIKLSKSIGVYIERLESDNDSISELKRKLTNVKDEKVNDCFNRTNVPNDILDSLYPKG